MSKIKAFLKQNAAVRPNAKVVVSDRFLDDNGKPVEWEIRALSVEEDAKINNACTERKRKRGKMTVDFDHQAYIRKMVIASVVDPPLADAELQASYGVTSGEDLLGTMLYSGEFAELQKAVQEINGFDPEIFEETKEETKNS